MMCYHRTTFGFHAHILQVSLLVPYVCVLNQRPTEFAGNRPYNSTQVIGTRNMKNVCKYVCVGVFVRACLALSSGNQAAIHIKLSNIVLMLLQYNCHTLSTDNTCVATHCNCVH